jgi:geranylgeranyl diphosphate synthase, type II
MNTLKTTDVTSELSVLNEFIESFLSQKIAASAKIDPYYQQLWTQIARLFQSGGKKLRSRTVLLSYSMYGGKDTEGIMPAAIAQELLHLGMLIHDDIIDRDIVRYGVANIAGGYRQLYSDVVRNEHDREHYAGGAALLAGDLMISESYLLIAQSNVDAKKILEIQKMFGQSIFEVIGGELLDTESAFRKPGEIKAETIALYKTASYSFTMPLLVGAELANAPQEEQVKLRNFGRNLGIAFQLRDDIIGVFGDEAETGKTTSGDIREGKKTMMIEYFYRLADEQQRQQFTKYFGKTTITEDEVSIVRQLLRDSGALQATENAIESYEAEARSVLAQLNIVPPYYQEVEVYISRATKRVK